MERGHRLGLAVGHGGAVVHALDDHGQPQPANRVADAAGGEQRLGRRDVEVGVHGQLGQVHLGRALDGLEAGQEGAGAGALELGGQAHHGAQLGIEIGDEDVHAQLLAHPAEASAEGLAAHRGIGQDGAARHQALGVEPRIERVVAQPDDAPAEARLVSQGPRHRDPRRRVVGGVHAGDGDGRVDEFHQVPPT
jgi:hypothetical protein